MSDGKFKQYLGDGVYADFDGIHIILSVSDGVQESERVFMDIDVFEALLRYGDWICDGRHG